MPHDPADRHLAAVKPWLRSAAQKIADKIEDAAAHAEKSLTRSVKNAAEGRATWRAVAGQRSAKAAQQRVDELMAWLVGPSKTSLEGHVQNARAQFYRDAFAHWKPQIASAVRDDTGPTLSGERAARGLVIWNALPKEEIAPIFVRVKTNLQGAINAAAVQSLGDRQRQQIIDGWEQSTVEAIQGKVREMLSDSQVAIYSMVGPQMIRAEFRE